MNGACVPGLNTGGNPLVAAFAAKMRNWRRSSRMPMKEVAMDIGISVATVSEWEHGNRFPSVEHLLAISRLARMPAPCLICGTNSHCPRGRRDRTAGPKVGPVLV